MSMLISAQSSWLRYFTELSIGGTSRVESGKSEPDTNEGELDFDAVLQKTIAEYGATRDHLEMLEKKLSKMIEIKEAKARNDYELAKRNLALSEKEGQLVRKILSSNNLGEDDTDTIRGKASKDDARPVSPRPMSPDNQIVDDRDNELPNLSSEDHTRSLAEELEQMKQRLAEEEQARIAAENSLFVAENQAKLDTSHARITIKNEEAARAKADAAAIEQAKARYAAEQEIQRLRTELKLVGMDATQQRGGIPFATGQVEKRDQWLGTRSPEELQDLQGAVMKALDGGEKRRTLDGTKKRKLSKSHRLKSHSTDMIGNDAIGNTVNLGEAI
ncbi:hypothetical protein M408DRAFT_9500 [Serendipita vermifera MAFF 305830]|uniref:Uncharacterized protein n=1 Tax=Serendipita vermifera MAFF 305830 TaxID=933852 RepID=A0A0C3B6P2_SERVB|nr:hypothetical protein M408DRAFT_9500 [Serendipita vermifera MAFF 305830]